MIIGKKMEKSINEQIRAEFQSSYLYLSMATWFESQNLPGCAHWMNKQAHEEWEHGMRFYKYLVSRGGRVILDGLDKPQNEWKSTAEVFAHVVSHEEKVTALINSMFELAEKEKDYASKSMLIWFINEQVEEEEHAAAILCKIKMLGENPISLAMLDKELGARA
jgi:ferritin